MVELKLITFLIVCPLVFLSGFVDAIGGGGGLISLPAYIFAGLPMHMAIGTNKLASSIGTTVSTVRYVRQTKVDWVLALPAICLSLTGSRCGSMLALIANEAFLKRMMLIVLPVAAFFVLRKSTFAQENGEEVSVAKRRIATWIGAFFVGGYDGFYGPGAGTFILIVLVVFARMKMMDAAVYTKLINLTSNVTALVTFLMNGKVVLVLGLVSGVFSMLGHFTGSSLMLKNGEKIVRPIIICVLILLFIKVMTGM